MKTASQVVIIYEDKKTRERAVSFCDQLVKRFWSQCEFEMTWLSFADLEDEALLRTGANTAASATLLIFALLRGREMTFGVCAWLDTWLAERGEREGAIVGLEDPGSSINRAISPNYIYLRSIAHRAGLDYLTQLPETMTRSVPDSLDSVAARAHQITSVLDQILQKKGPSETLTR
jgi:hypothetical protein